jgi:four helix bundle protein
VKIVSFRDLIVWQKALALCVEVYRASAAFPRDERFGLVAEIRKTARSVVYNIAEGHRRRSTAEYIRFVDISRASGAELETQIILAAQLAYLEDREARILLARADEVGRMLAALLRALDARVKGVELSP